jgi:UDP-N-acetylmuramate dehydrogenase
MTLAETFPDILRTDVPLGPMTSFGIGGIARQVVQPRTLEETTAVMAYLAETGTGHRILGGGTNLLVKSREIAEPVVYLGKLCALSLDGERVRVEAGVPLGRLVTRCGREGLAGLEALAGIPGTLGGALMMNSGGRHGWIGEVVSEVTCVDAGGLTTLPAEKVCFAYRNSSLRGRVVAAAELLLKRDDAAEIALRRGAVLAEKRRGQPLTAKSAGCVFRNPPGQYAGQLIEAAGFKGARVGGAMVSPLHANFIVNTGGATADDVLRLIEKIREKILKNYNVLLELEIEIW